MIENVTIYSKNLLKNYLWRALKAPLIINIIILFCTLASGLVNIYALGDTTTGYVLICIALFLALFVISAICNAFKRNINVISLINEYKFTPEILEATTFSSSNIEIGKSILHLKQINKVVENKNALYLYLDKTRALLLDINGFKDKTDKLVLIKYLQMANPKIVINR